MITETFHTRFHQAEPRDATVRHNLSMLITPDTFQFALFDADYKRVHELGHVTIPEPLREEKHHAERIEFLLHNYGLQMLNYDHVNISLLNGDFTLVPPAFAGQPAGRELLDFAGSSAGRVRADRLSPEVDFYYSGSEAVIQLLERNFSKARIRHAGAVAIQMLFTHHALMGCNVLLNVHENHIELAARKNGQFIFYNVFAVSGPEDVLYYLLFMAEQLMMKGSDIRLGLCGPVAADGELYRLLSRYTGKLTPAVNDPSLQLSSKMLTVPLHYYFTLLNQHLCES